MLVTVCACSGGTKTQPPPAKPAQPPPATMPQQRVITAEAFCDRLVALGHCPWAKQFAVERRECIDTLSQAQYQTFRDKFGPCVLDHSDCEEVAACISDSAVEKGDLRACSDKDPGRTVGMPRAEWEHRKGADVKPPGRECHQPAHREPLRAKEPAGASQWVPNAHGRCQ